MTTIEAKKIFRDIVALKIQGAEKVARAAVDAFELELAASKAKSRQAFLKEARAAMFWLRSSRPTEPALRNALRFIFSEVRKSKQEDVGELKALASKEALLYEKKEEQMRKKIAEYGARVVPNDGIVLVHCHSSTVVSVLLAAKRAGKKFQVYACETRPLFQGRRTALEVSQAGIPCKLVVDSAGRFVLQRFMRDTDIVMVGADAITSSGDLFNKIGTSQLALAAHEHEKRFYSCAGTHKFDSLTLWGSEEVIEMRSPDEVAVARDFGLKKMPSKLEALNPAFDFTEAENVTAYITELGVIPPQSLTAVVWREFDLDREQRF